VCGWQVKLCDPLVTRGPYLSALEIRSLYIKRYINSPSLLFLTWPRNPAQIEFSLLSAALLSVKRISSVTSFNITINKKKTRFFGLHFITAITDNFNHYDVIGPQISLFQ